MGVYIAVLEETYGPYETSQMASMLEKGELDIPSTTYWMEGMETWEPLANFSPAKVEPPPVTSGDSYGPFKWSDNNGWVERPTAATSHSQVYGSIIKKGEFIGVGALVQALGLLVLILGGVMFNVIVLILGLVFLIIGSRLAIKTVCSNCRVKLTDNKGKVCPACRCHFTK